MKLQHLTLCCSLAAVLSAADPPCYGAEDFLPTPEHAIGFQADGNGWYPGARPGMVEWWDGRPDWAKVPVRERDGDVIKDTTCGSSPTRCPRTSCGRC